MLLLSEKEDNFELTEHFVQELIRQIKAHEAPDLIFLQIQIIQQEYVFHLILSHRLFSLL